MGREVTGLYIGARNVRRNFPKHTAAIELQLGHLHIRCELTPGFWRGQPELHDPRLCAWLKFKLYHERSCRSPLPLALIPSGRNAYKLRPLLLPPVSLAPSGWANGQSKDGLTVLPFQRAEGKPPCGDAPCRVSSYMACSAQTTW